IRRAPSRAISSSSKSCSPASLPAPLSTTFNIGGVSFHPAPTGVRVAYAEGYAAFFIAAPDPQLSVITLGDWCIERCRFRVGEACNNVSVPSVNTQFPTGNVSLPSKLPLEQFLAVFYERRKLGSL